MAPQNTRLGFVSISIVIPLNYRNKPEPGYGYSLKQCRLALDGRFLNLLTVTVWAIICSMAAGGIVYLLHFDRPYTGRMQHYVSLHMTWTEDWKVTGRALLV